MKLMITAILCLGLVSTPVFPLTVPSSAPVGRHQIAVYGGGAAGGDTAADDEYRGIDREAVFVFGAMITILGLGCFGAINGVQRSTKLEESEKDASTVALAAGGIIFLGFGIWMMAEGDGRACGNACGEAGCELGCRVAAEVAAQGCIEAILSQ